MTANSAEAETDRTMPLDTVILLRAINQHLPVARVLMVEQGLWEQGLWEQGLWEQGLWSKACPR